MRAMGEVMGDDAALVRGAFLFLLRDEVKHTRVRLCACCAIRAVAAPGHSRRRWCQRWSDLNTSRRRCAAEPGGGPPLPLDGPLFRPRLSEFPHIRIIDELKGPACEHRGAVNFTASEVGTFVRVTGIYAARKMRGTTHRTCTARWKTGAGRSCSRMSRGDRRGSDVP